MLKTEHIYCWLSFSSKLCDIIFTHHSSCTYLIHFTLMLFDTLCTKFFKNGNSRRNISWERDNFWFPRSWHETKNCFYSIDNISFFFSRFKSNSGVLQLLIRKWNSKMMWEYCQYITVSVSFIRENLIKKNQS